MSRSILFTRVGSDDECPHGWLSSISCQLKISENDVKAAPLAGAMTRNLLASGATPHSGPTPLVWKSVVGKPTFNSGPRLTGTDAIAPSGVIYRSSLPSDRHLGAVPPDLETMTLFRSVSSSFAESGRNAQTKTS